MINVSYISRTFKMKYILILLLSSVIGWSVVQCSKILIVPAHFSSASHKKSMIPFAEELGKQGHEVHFWNMEYAEKKVKSPYFHDDQFIVKTDVPWIRDLMQYGNDSESEKMPWTAGRTTPIQFNVVWFFASLPCKTVIENHRDELDRVANAGWDYMIFESFFTPCTWMLRKLAPKDTKIISISSSHFIEFTSTVRAHSRHVIANPAALSAMDHDISLFWKRFEALFDFFLAEIGHVTTNGWIMYYRLGQYYSDFTSRNQENLALFALSGFPEIVDWPRPKNNDAKYYIGGNEFCSGSLKELEEEYKSFVEDPSSKGTIIAAFGHHTSWNAAPKNVIESFVKGFERLKDYRIIWQYTHGPEIPKMDHVKVVTWFPQKELLHHPNTKVFISHMGLKSMGEGVCAGVPLAAFPLFAEQPRNAANMKYLGLSLPINKFTVTPDSFYDTLISLATEVKYKQNAVKWATYIREGYMISPQSESVFWLDFVGKYEPKSNKFLYNKGRNLGYISYFCLDVIMVGLTVICLMIYILVKFLSILFKCLVERKV